MSPEGFRVKIPDERWFEENIGCQDACPVITDAPAYTAAIIKGEFNRAFEINRGDNLFPSILGRICVHPYEEECRRGVRFDRPISICSLKQASADFRVEPTKRRDLDEIRRKEKIDKKVAIMGAGPSGLAAANDLARMGYRVTAYESLPVKGGMLNVEIPPKKKECERAYVGSQDCIDCHEDMNEEYIRVWRNSPMTTMAYLRIKDDPDREKCYPCYNTSYNPKKNAFVERNIGCEACHGPGEKYQAMMMGAEAEKGGEIANENARKSCGKCHNPHIPKEIHAELAR